MSYNPLMEKRESYIIFTIDTYKYVILFVIHPLCIILSQNDKLFTAGEYEPPGKTHGYYKRGTSIWEFFLKIY